MDELVNFITSLHLAVAAVQAHPHLAVMNCDTSGACPVFDVLSSSWMNSAIVTLWGSVIALVGSAYWQLIDGAIALASDLNL
mmetsp:Transcript_25703/g.39525  ORF Transcript_25703/g.39525 Transcript_25703/m.39525 type:complete len:82 (-) Transcript_25703:18-263(-)